MHEGTGLAALKDAPMSLSTKTLSLDLCGNSVGDILQRWGTGACSAEGCPLSLEGQGIQ